VRAIPLALCLVASACAWHSSRPDPLVSEEDDPAAGHGPPVAADDAPPPAPAKPACAVAAPKDRHTSGTIARAELDQVLNAGPGAFLQGVRVDPELDGGHFRGWRVRTFWPCDARYAHVDLVAGDVVVRVNGSSIERPETLMHVWDGLREATALDVELDRDGAPVHLRYAIAD
jgi:general secretion pathway protein C